MALTSQSETEPALLPSKENIVVVAFNYKSRVNFSLDQTSTKLIFTILLPVVLLTYFVKRCIWFYFTASQISGIPLDWTAGHLAFEKKR